MQRLQRSVQQVRISVTTNVTQHRRSSTTRSHDRVAMKTSAPGSASSNVLQCFVVTSRVGRDAVAVVVIAGAFLLVSLLQVAFATPRTAPTCQGTGFVEEFFLSGGPSSSAAVRVVVVHDIKEEEGERQ